MDKKNQAFKGHETWWAAVQMNIKMYLHIALLLLIAQVIITLALSYIWYREPWTIVINYTCYAIREGQFTVLLDRLVPLAGRLLMKSIWIFVLSFSAWIFYPAIIRKFSTRAREQSAEKYVRGAQLLTAEELNRQIRRAGEKTHIRIGNVAMPVAAEPKHAFIIGRPGTGKTVAMRGVIDNIRDRADRAVIYDFKGDYLCKFFNPSTDVIFNPLDTRSVGWSLFNEIETAMDIDSVSVSLIPPAISSNDPFWNDAARDVFSGILHYLYQNRLRTNADIWAAVTAAGADISAWLKDCRGGERGYRYIEDASSKQALSVFAVMMQYVKSFEYMAKMRGDFSLKRWIENARGGIIFVTSYADIEATLRPILSLFVDLLGRKLLSLPDDYDRRIFFVLDEFGTLQRLSTIQKLLTLARSKGGAAWIGIQDIGQLDKIYTHSGRQTIVNACGSNLIFSVADPDTAKFLSDKIGEREYIETEETHSMGVQDNRDGISLMRRKKTERLILPSEIQNLRDLHGLIKFPGYHYGAVTLEYRGYSDVTESFVCRPDLSLEHIMQAEADILAAAAAATGSREREDRDGGPAMQSERQARKDNRDRGAELELEND